MDDKAVSAVVGFIFIVLIAITFIGVVQSVMLPEWNKGVEVDHSIELSHEIAKIGEAISLSSATGKSTLVSLNLALSYPKRPFLVSPTFASATISAEKQHLSIKSDKISYEGDTYSILILPNYHYSPRPKFLYEHSATFKSYDGNPISNSMQSSFTPSSVNLYILNTTFSSLAVNEPVNLIFEPVSYGGKTLVHSAWINFTVSNETAEWWNNTLSQIYGADNVSKNGNWINVSVGDVYLSLNYLIAQVSTSQSRAEISASRQAVNLVNLSNPPSEVYKGVTVPLGVRVLDKFYNPVPEMNVDILINSDLVDTEKTDDNGEVWYYFEANATGNYNIEFRIPSDSYTYNLSVISPPTAGGIFDISWNATPSGDIFVDDWNVSSEGSQKQYKVTVTYEGNPVSDARIDLSTDSPNLVYIPAEAVTDANGESTVAITALDNGTANVIAASGGSSAVLRLFITGAGGSVCPAGWSYWREITITNSGSALSDYQIKVVLNTSNFDFSKANIDGSDIRFYDSDGITQLNYWIEEWSANYAVIWVKVPSIPSGTKKIYMYYGNPSATSLSNGSATFDFFDDFDDGDVSDWREVNSLVSAVTFGGKNVLELRPVGVTYYQHLAVPSATFPLTEYTLEAYIYDENPAGSVMFHYKDDNNWWSLELYSPYYDIFRPYITGVDRGWVYLHFPCSISAGSWYRIKVNVFPDKFEMYINDVLKWSRNVAAQYQFSGYSKVGFVEHRGYGPLYADWIFVRKYASPEPTVSIGAEQRC